MKPTENKVLRALEENPLQTFKWFERGLAAFLVSIPLILYLTDKNRCGMPIEGFRDSISNYVYMWHSYVYGLLLGTASMLFIFNGVIYFKNETENNIVVDRSGKWYNLILGVCLLGVVVFPHKEFSVIHYIFAGAFFMGNAVITMVFHTKTWRKSNTFLGILTVVGLAFYFLDEYWLHWFPGYTLFWAEWISVAVVAVHFFLDSLD
ncbi:DUF7103 family protein [Flavobacterium silvaticum]|uniref:DUF998 domain-containing protein n=1 Tax=Flavobacterium silvaticum TaxID=1852020 RepID=A0A972JH97_9FLAO|nr:hypothetical protein [Flavobacterium silvaticum]NMH26893.1 hypothetical protein [Flavobacterium silvaticum]